jgi:hypothetical protein
MSEIVIYCPECGAEYREGFTTCRDCNVALIRRPASEANDDLVPLAHEASFELVGELLDRLEKNAVPYVIQAGTALELFDDSSTPITKPQPWEARVWVLGSRQRLATEIFDQLLDERNVERGSQLSNRHLYPSGSGTHGGG